LAAGSADVLADEYSDSPYISGLNSIAEFILLSSYSAAGSADVLADEYSDSPYISGLKLIAEFIFGSRFSRCISR
jgi:hypothetical protein